MIERMLPTHFTKEPLILLVLLLFGVAQSSRAQDPPEGEAPASTTKAPARSGYSALKLEELPRDEKGFLKPEVWDIIQKEAKARPASNEARTLKERPIYQAYCATYANWKAPEPLPVQEGRPRNLSEPPKEPRFPLTVKVRLPNQWKIANARQKDVDIPVQVVIHEGAPYALVKAIPDRGQITLTPSTAG